jgi:hypothetical protein
MIGKIKKICCLVSLLVLCICNLTWAQVEDELRLKSKPANVRDVVGTWEMAYQAVRSDVSSDSLFFADYQVIKFLDDGYVKNVASTKALGASDVRMYLDKTPKKTTYSFFGDGMLVISRSQKDFDNIVVSIITENMKEPLREGAPLLKKGDLILAYFDPSKQVYMQRYLRKKYF